MTNRHEHSRTMDRGDEDPKREFVCVEQYLSNACRTPRKTIQVGFVLDFIPGACIDDELGSGRNGLLKILVHLTCARSFG